MACLLMSVGALAQDKVVPPEDSAALARILVDAKARGYASGNESQIRRLPDGGREVRSERDGYVYQDRWYGGERFTGQEVLWHQGRAVWSMTFYGATTPGRKAPADFPAFHKSALRRASIDAPFRGPALYREGEYTYLNTWVGSVEEFSGVERVFFRDEEVFHLTYQGGSLHE